MDEHYKTVIDAQLNKVKGQINMVKNISDTATQNEDQEINKSMLAFVVNTLADDFGLLFSSVQQREKMRERRKENSDERLARLQEELKDCENESRILEIEKEIKQTQKRIEERDKKRAKKAAEKAARDGDVKSE
jgi:asparagine synthetase B (glutamine-hydrolysing)